MDKEWPNLKENNIDFWRHEWNTHGKCSEDNFDQFKYFDITLAKKKEVDILKYLEEADIKPNGASYESGNICEAIKKKHFVYHDCGAKIRHFSFFGEKENKIKLGSQNG